MGMIGKMRGSAKVMRATGGVHVTEDIWAVIPCDELKAAVESYLEVLKEEETLGSRSCMVAAFAEVGVRFLDWACEQEGEGRSELGTLKVLFQEASCDWREVVEGDDFEGSD